MAITGMFSVLCWNSVLPGRHDGLVLSPLPVRTRTIFLAKLGAIATSLSVAVFAINAFTGLWYPFVVIPASAEPLGGLRSLAAYWAAMVAAGVFVFCSLLAAQGVAARVLSYGLFLRVSGFLHLTAFFLILGVYFLTPPLATTTGLTASENQGLLRWLPSYWFLGFFQELNGATHPAFRPLAARAGWGLLTAFSVAALAYALAYDRNIRRIIEQPDIAPVDRSRPASRLGGYLAKKTFAKSVDRAIVLFIARTIARSRQHRLLLAAYGGIALAIALAYTKSLLYGYSRQRWDEVNVPFLAAAMVPLFFAVIGVRAVFALPIALPCNWIFRVTAVHSPAAYFAAMRKSLFALTAVPIWIASAIVYFGIWPGRPALEHMIVLVLVGILLVERCLHRFRKLPFACSYLPGRANLNVRLGAYGIGFLFATDVGVRFEFWAIQKMERFVVLFAILLAIAVWARRRTVEFAGAAYNRLQFEEVPANEAYALDLRRDGAWSSDEAYVDAIDLNFGRTLAVRMKRVASGAVVLVAAGAIYEQAGQWRDRKLLPQIGRSIDIGGRSLNVCCLGEGSPTVILESGYPLPGYSWVFVQRRIAEFTRACWYDRAGRGWSDPGPDRFYGASVARDLHNLLRSAQVPPPYVLVGHSIGGLYIRVYTGFYPGEVAGLVFVDPTHEDLPHPRPRPEFLRRLQLSLTEIFGRIGLFRLMATPPDQPPKA